MIKELQLYKTNMKTLEELSELQIIETLLKAKNDFNEAKAKVHSKKPKDSEEQSAEDFKTWFLNHIDNYK